MFSRRHLVQRSRGTPGETESPARSQQRNSHGGALQLSTELPPYEPLECALTPSARENLDRLKSSHDHGKYKKHIKSSILAVTEAATSSNDRLYERKAIAQKQAEKRERDGREDEEPTQEEKEDANYVKTFNKKVKVMTEEPEKALRELIDYDDELAMFSNRLEGVIEAIGDVPAPRRGGMRRPRNVDAAEGDSDNPDEEEPEEELPAIAPSDLYTKALTKYERDYRSKSMRARYDINDYKNFKRVVHDAQHPEENAPPVPHANTWFPEDNAGSNRNNGGDESSDDEIEIATVTANLKDLFSLQYFKEPWTSKNCGHTFEKSEFLNYLQNVGSDFQEPPPSRRRVRKVKCPQNGCDQMHVPEDFSLDKVIMRQVKRAQEMDARDDDPDEEDDDPAPRGTQSRRPHELDSDDDDEDEDESPAQVSRVKQERGGSRAPGRAPPRSAEDSDVEVDD